MPRNRQSQTEHQSQASVPGGAVAPVVTSLENEVAEHIVMSYLGLPGPLMFCAHGPPGEGKSTGVMKVGAEMGVAVLRPPAHLFESAEAGNPAKELLAFYKHAQWKLDKVGTAEGAHMSRVKKSAQLGVFELGR